MGELLMPSLGADMERGTVLEWLVHPGDTVRRGDAVVVIDTEKSDIEAETFESGTVVALLVEEGTEVEVGTPLALIDGDRHTASPGEVAPAPPVTTTEIRVPRPVGWAPTSARTAGVVLSPLVRHLAEERGVDPTTIHPSGPGRRVRRHDVDLAVAACAPPDGRRRVSPLARRLAARAGIDVATITGSGPGGAVVRADLGPLTARSAAPRDRRERTRASIADAMARANREIPHYYLQTTIDLHAAIEWLRGENERRSVTERILPAALLLAATARAAARHPELNGRWEDGHRPADHVHLGVAIARRGGGLVAPGIADADRMTLDELMPAFRDLVGRARAGRLGQSEYTGPTITVTSLGDLGVDVVFGVVNPPQLAMVGFGTIHDAPLVVDGTVVVHPVVVASLAADHRASDGMSGAAFLAAVEALLREPERLQEAPR